jgi:hypothetical protein
MYSVLQFLQLEIYDALYVVQRDWYHVYSCRKNLACLYMPLDKNEEYESMALEIIA